LLQTAKVMIVEDLRAKHASPPIRFYTDYYNNNIHYTNKNTDKTLEDQNHNGRIEGDNGDGIYENTESWTETNPGDDDTDDYTFKDGEEKGWGYNPLSKDTDGDGLNDNIEDSSNYGTRDASETSAKSSDTDGVGISDKMEREGWTVLIIYENTYEIINEYTVTSNPMVPDADNDGINDGGVLASFFQLGSYDNKETRHDVRWMIYYHHLVQYGLPIIFFIVLGIILMLIPSGLGNIIGVCILVLTIMYMIIRIVYSFILINNIISSLSEAKTIFNIFEVIIEYKPKIQVWKEMSTLNIISTIPKISSNEDILKKYDSNFNVIGGENYD